MTAARFAPARSQIDRTVAPSNPFSANSSPAASSSLALVGSSRHGHRLASSIGRFKRVVSIKCMEIGRIVKADSRDFSDGADGSTGDAGVGSDRPVGHRGHTVGPSVGRSGRSATAVGGRSGDGTTRDGRERVVVCVVGTRPEAVKMAPIVLRLRAGRGPARPAGLDRPASRAARPGPGRLRARRRPRPRPDAARPDARRDRPAGPSSALDGVRRAERPDFVLAQGDTTTVLAAALASYYRQVPFGHVEAGLRTGQPYRPFPEEKNRVLAGHLAELHFAPTPRARLNLLREGIDDALDPRHRQHRDRRPPADRRPAGPAARSSPRPTG